MAMGFHSFSVRKLCSLTNTVSVTTAGTNYAVDNIITISGTELGGASPTNDLLLTVLTVDSTGGVLTGVANGTPAGEENKYYLKVIAE